MKSNLKGHRKTKVKKIFSRKKYKFKLLRILIAPCNGKMTRTEKELPRTWELRWEVSKKSINNKNRRSLWRI